MHWVKGLDKSIEGGLAFIFTSLLCWLCLSTTFPIFVPRLVLPTIASAVFEAFSSQNDNLFLPLYYFTMILIM